MASAVDPVLRMPELFDLTGRVAIVTGGTRGIGYAIAQGFIAAGAGVVIGGRKEDRCRSAAAELGGRAASVAVNMGDLAAAEALVDSAVANFGRVDIVVNNAATAVNQPLGQMTAAAFDKVFAVNVRGPLMLVQAALPWLREAPGASVINVISPAVRMYAADVALYASSKSALLSLTRSMAEAFAADDVRVNALSPGPTDTNMLRTHSEEVQQATRDATLLRRIADPRELVAPALFLATPASSFMTGQVLTVDGGMVPC